MIIYDGPSMIDGKRIIVVVTGLKARSRNSKTGDMIQTYILRADRHPIAAVRSGADESICGDCKHRGDGMGNGRSCYVTLAHGPASVWQAWLRGVYETVTPEDAGQLVAGRMVRLGTYGDPAAAPRAIWQELVKHAAGWTGYSHRTRHIDPAWSRLVMASADTPEEAAEAQRMGYRTFRVGREAQVGEVLCPASVEAGKRTDCASCRACMGTSGKARASIYIPPHGAGRRHFREGGIAA